MCKICEQCEKPYKNYENYCNGPAPWHYEHDNRAEGRCQVCYMKGRQSYVEAPLNTDTLKKYRIYPPFMSTRPYNNAYHDVYLCEEHRNYLLGIGYGVVPEIYTK